MTDECVTCKVEDRVHILSLNRPDKLNALDLEMFRRLDRHLAESLDGAACVLLRANGRSFCAGQTSTTMRPMSPTKRNASPTPVEKLATLPMPLAAAGGVVGNPDTTGRPLASAG